MCWASSCMCSEFKLSTLTLETSICCLSVLFTYCAAFCPSVGLMSLLLKQVGSANVVHFVNWEMWVVNKIKVVFSSIGFS